MRWTTEDYAAAERETRLRRLPLAAMFTALGVLLPQIFHALGLGSTLLPMFLPVLAAALLLPLQLAVTVGILTPLLSWMLTGMPPLSPPMLPLLLIELPITAAVASLLRRRLRLPVIAAITAAMVTDRLLLWLVIETVTRAAGVQHPLFGPALVLAGLPGVILQLVVLPPAVHLVDQRFPSLSVIRFRRPAR